MTDLVLSIRLTGDGKGLVGEARVSREEIEKLGQTAKQSNDKAKTAADQYLASLKRQAETLGMTKSQTLAYEASQLKLTDAQREGVAQSIKAIGAHDSNVEVLGRLRLATYAVAAAAAVAGQQFVSMLFGQIEAIANYKRLAEVAGTTAEKFSGFEVPARLASTSLDSVATSVAFLGKSLGDARLGDVSKTSLFQALGIDPKDGRDAAEVMVDMAKALSGMTDQTVAGKVAGDLLGRSYAELRPFMKNLAEQGELVARTTNEDAQAADRFQSQLTRISLASQKAKQSLAVDLLPAVSNVVDEFVRGQKEGGLFAGVLAGFRTAVTGTDRQKNDQELFELTERQLDLERRLAQVRNNAPGFRGSMKALEAELADVNSRLQTTLAYRKLLDDPAAATGAAPAAAPAAAGAGGTSGAEDRVRERMEFEKHYQERLAGAQGFYERYAEATKSGQALTQEALKQGLLGRSEVVEQDRAAEDARLQVLINSLQQQQRLHEQMGDLAQARIAQEKIAAAEAARIANDAIAQARQTSGKTTFEKEMADIRNQFNAKLAQEIANIELQNMTEMELLQHQTAEKQAWLDSALEKGYINEKFYAEQVTRLHDAEVKKRFGIAKVYREVDLESASFFMGQMAAMMQSKSRAMFEVGKAAAISKTIIDTISGARGAFAALSSIPYVGPVLGAAAAAAAIVAGMAQVQQIRSTPFGGGSVSGGASPVFSANPVTGVPDAPIGAGAPPGGSGSSQVVVNVTVQGNVLGNREFIDDQLIPAIRDAVDNRDFVIIGQNSRQAANLALA